MLKKVPTEQILSELSCKKWTGLWKVERKMFQAKDIAWRKLARVKSYITSSNVLPALWPPWLHVIPLARIFFPLIQPTIPIRTKWLMRHGGEKEGSQGQLKNRKDGAAIPWNENLWEEHFEEEDKGSCKKEKPKQCTLHRQHLSRER